MATAGIPYMYMGADDFQAYANNASVALADVVEFINNQ